MTMMASSRPRADHFSSDVMKYGRASCQASFRKGPRPRMNGLSLAGWKERLVRGAEPGFDPFAAHAEVGFAVGAAGMDDQPSGTRGLFLHLHHGQVRKVGHYT